MKGTTVEFELTAPAYGTAMIAADDSVWIAIQPKWWDLATWIWWWFCPSDRKSAITIRVANGVGGADFVRTRAVRVAKKYVRVRKHYQVGALTPPRAVPWEGSNGEETGEER